jgi:UDP-3-O-[3-hydroxymyristoyl] N-acetylglucosamine deacetylase
MYQTTIREEVKFESVGLHTGNKVKLVLKPAKEDTGIVFLKDNLIVKADYNNVFNDKFEISLKSKDLEVKTVEHLLSAFYGLGINNVICEICGEEVPFYDGSCLKFVSALNRIGIKKLRKKMRIFDLKKELVVNKDDRYIIALPHKSLKISYFVHYENPLIGSQFKEIYLTKDVFVKEISKARTFGWISQVREQRKMGLIKGGNLSNAILFGKNKILNKQGLRYKDEVIRHKILDLIGALALLPFRINAHIIAIKSGHSLDIEFIKKIGGVVCQRR